MKKYIFILIAIILAIFLFFYLLKIALSSHVKAKFANLRPFHTIVPVYFKGVKVGKVLSRNHSKDYNHTILTLVIYPHDFRLKEGTVAYLKRHKLHNYLKQDYIELVFPDSKTESYLPKNATIDGIATIDINDFGANQNLDEIEKIKDDLAQAAENLNYAIGGLSDLFQAMKDILEENKSNVYKTTTNVSNATGNFSNVTKKFDNSINQIKLNSTFDNIATVTQSLNGTASSFNSNMDEIDATICNLQEITNDTSAITKGVRQTLSKPFGGFRLFFGRTIQGKSCP